MLAHKYNDYKDKIDFPVLVSPKIDGCRMIATKDGLYTRNGKEYLSCPHISKLLAPIFEKYPEWVIDGEIYSHDNNFEKIVSLVKQSKPTKEDLKASEEIIVVTRKTKELVKDIQTELKLEYEDDAINHVFTEFIEQRK